MRVFQIRKNIFRRLHVLWLLVLTISFAVVVVQYRDAAAKPGPSGRYWVMLRDKGLVSEEQHRIDLLRSEWTERSIKRRKLSGAGLDEMDLPVCREYIEQVHSTGAKVLRTSRWINAVSVEADTCALSLLSELDCVSGVRPVASFTRADIDLEQVENLLTYDNDEITGAFPLGGYGPSYRQAEQAGVLEAHRRGFTGAGVLLGMLDTGFQLDHRAFTGIELVAQYDFIFDDADPSYDPRTDLSGQANHGTACLSVIVGYDPGHLIGIAPRAAVAVAKTELTGSETRVEEDYWVAGIEWLEWLGVDVVSSSLSYSDWYNSADYNGVTPLVTRAAQRAFELGVVICNSAGNAGPELATIGAPADAPGVLAIAAVDSTGRITGFSSRGPSSDGRIKPDVAAMGRKVACVRPLTWDRYSFWNGTSLACPVVAGVAVLVREAHPDWSSRMVVEALRSTSSRAFAPDTAYGYGIVDAAAAIDYPALSGRIVRLLDGSGVSGAELNLTSKGKTWNTTSDDAGFYSFVNLPEGSYNLTVIPSQLETLRFNELNLPPSLPFDIVVHR